MKHIEPRDYIQYSPLLFDHLLYCGTLQEIALRLINGKPKKLLSVD